MATRYTCYVPKEWSAYPQQYLATTITDKAIKQWKHCKKLEGTTIRLENVTATFQYHQFCPWMRKTGDKNQRPCNSQYVGIPMDCILCSSSCCTYGSRYCTYK